MGTVEIANRFCGPSASGNGVFLATTTYETRSGKPPTRTVPFIVAKRLRPDSTGRDSLGWRDKHFTVIAMIVLGVIVSTFVLIRQLKRRRAVPSSLRVREPGPRR